MRISDIKYKASEILNGNKEILMKVFIFMGIVSAILTYIRNLLSGSTIGSIVSLVILVATLTFTQGYIRASLKAVNNRFNEIDMQNDGLTGFYRFKELFGTYFIHGFFLLIVVFVVGLIGFAMIGGMLSNSTIGELGKLFSLDVQSIVSSDISFHAAQDLQAIMGFVFLFVIVLLIVVLVYLSNFALTFYIVEKYDIRGIDAMKESMKLMKGYKKTYILLCLSYFGWILLVGVLETAIGYIIPVPLLISIAGVVISNILYNTHMNVSLAVFYEEIDLSKNVD